MIVGIDAHGAAEQVAAVMEDAGSAGVIVDTRENLAKIPLRVRASLKFVLLLEPADGSEEPDIIPWSRAAASSTDREMTDAGVLPDDAATLIYTSGTTGTPKGIEYTHRQLLLACQAILDEFPAGLPKVSR